MADVGAHVYYQRGSFDQINHASVMVQSLYRGHRARHELKKAAADEASEKSAIAAVAANRAASKKAKVTIQEDATLDFCKAHGIVFEAYAAMRGCPFSNPKVLAIAQGHGVGVSQVCLRWVLQKGAAMAVGLGANATRMPSYATEDLDLYSFELTTEEMATLSATGKQIPSCAQGY